MTITPEQAAVTEKLRRARAEDAHTKHLTLYGRYGRRTVVLADSEPGGPDSPHPGDEVMSDDELAEAFAGRDLPANVLYVDQWGVWISGVAPVTDADGSVVAVVSADIPAAEGVTEVEGLRSNVAETFASMLHNAAAQSGRTELEAITDGLTGLYNHRYFHERLSEEIERCQEQATSLALLFCDLDNFRAFNDLHGHGSGDKALRAVAGVLKASPCATWTWSRDTAARSSPPSSSTPQSPARSRSRSGCAPASPTPGSAPAPTPCR